MPMPSRLPTPPVAPRAALPTERHEDCTTKCWLDANGAGPCKSGSCALLYNAEARGQHPKKAKTTASAGRGKAILNPSAIYAERQRKGTR
jgi:hypothetical protein